MRCLPCGTRLGGAPGRDDIENSIREENHAYALGQHYLRALVGGVRLAGRASETAITAGSDAGRGAHGRISAGAASLVASPICRRK